MREYLDELGRIKNWPGKRTNKLLVITYLANKFSYNRIYTEKEVNEIIIENHTFNDYFLLRRELIDNRLLLRVPNGAKYWRNDPLKGEFETEHLILHDSTLSEADDLKRVNASVAYLEQYTGTPHTDAYIDQILTEGDLPPKGSKEFYRVKSILCKENHEVIGFLEYYLGYPNDSAFWISTLYFKKEAQTNGYGQEVVHQIAKVIKEFGFSKMGIGVHLKNWQALRFWVKCDFKQIYGIYGDKVHGEDQFSLISLERYL